MRLAKTNISADVNFESTREFCKDYLTDGAPDVSVRVMKSDIARERDGATGAFSDMYLETLALYRKTAEALAARDVILFHSSAVAAGGDGFLFTAPSGTGKSTHASLWRKLLGAAAVMINDDKPLISCRGGDFTVYGTPWNGKHKLGANISAPIRGICVLSRGKENEIRRISPDEALPLLLMQTYRPTDGGATENVLNDVIKLSQDVPVYKMKCNMDISAAQTSYDAMKGTKNET